MALVKPNGSVEPDSIDVLEGKFTNLSDQNITTSTGTETVAESLDDRVVRVGSVAEGIVVFAGRTIPDGTQFSATGWHDGSTIGGHALVWDANWPKSEHGVTGWSPTVPPVSEQAGATLMGRTASYLRGNGETDAVGTGGFVFASPELMVAECYGVLRGVDATGPIQALSDNTGFVMFSAGPESDPYEIDYIITTRKTIFTVFNGIAHLKLLPPSVVNKAGIELVQPECRWSKDIHIDGNMTSRIGVQVSPGAHRTKVHVTAKNISADADASPSTAALAIFNSDDIEWSIYAVDIKNTGAGNESLPRAVTFADGGQRFHGDFLRTVNCDGSAIIATECQGVIDVVDITNCLDNGLYVGDDADIQIGTMSYNGSEEAVVCLFGGSATIGQLRVKGACGYVLNMGTAGRLINIGDLVVDGEPGASASGLMRTRPNNVQKSGTIRVGNIYATIAGERLFAFDTDIIEEVIIGKAIVKFFHVEGLTLPSNFGRFTSCEEVHISELDITVLTPGFSSSTIFELGTFTNLVRQSNFDNLKCKFEKVSDGSIDSNGVFRGRIAVTNMVQHKGATWAVGVSGWVRESVASSDNVEPDSFDAATPSGAYWYKGTDVSIRGATAAPFRSRCTVTGSPGTWVQY